MSMKSFFRFGAAVVLVLLILSPGFSADPPKVNTEKQAQAFLEQGETAWSKHNFEDAAQAYRQAIRVKPKLAEAHYGLGLCLARLERYPEAVKSFEQALYHKPGWSRAYKDLGVTYLKMNRWPDAEKAFKNAAERQPRDPEAWYDLGVVLGKQGKHQEAGRPLKRPWD